MRQASVNSEDMIGECQLLILFIRRPGLYLVMFTRSPGAACRAPPAFDNDSRFVKRYDKQNSGNQFV